MYVGIINSTKSLSSSSSSSSSSTTTRTKQTSFRTFDVDSCRCGSPISCLNLRSFSSASLSSGTRVSPEKGGIVDEVAEEEDEVEVIRSGSLSRGERFDARVFEGGAQKSIRRSRKFLSLDLICSTKSVNVNKFSNFQISHFIPWSLFVD